MKPSSENASLNYSFHKVTLDMCVIILVKKARMFLKALDMIYESMVSTSNNEQI